MSNILKDILCRSCKRHRESQNLMLKQDYCLTHSPYSNVEYCPNDVLYRCFLPQNRIQHHTLLFASVSADAGTHLQPWSSMNLMLAEDHRLVIFRVPFSLGLSALSSGLDSVYVFLAGQHKGCCAFSEHLLGRPSF